MMYEIFTANSRTEKRLGQYLNSKDDIKSKLDRLKLNPYKANGAHLLHGRLAGKWVWFKYKGNLHYRQKEQKNNHRSSGNT